MKDSHYYKQAELLLRILPVINRHSIFALKGGTALNFFIRNLPRLSVDIDLVYLPLRSRTESLKEISAALHQIEEETRKLFPSAQIHHKDLPAMNTTYALLLNSDFGVVKIEVNYIIRGSVYKPVTHELCEKAQEIFELAVKTTSLSFEELYAGKICAALDRQHPRDLFDVKLLFENEGLTERMRKAFIVYLISHNRPIVELLNPGLVNISETFEKEFKGMTTVDVSLQELYNVRDQLIKEISSSLTQKEKEFLISFKSLKPDWSLLDLDGIQNLPAVKWKLQNLQRMDKKKFNLALQKLESHLNRTTAN